MKQETQQGLDGAMSHLKAHWGPIHWEGSRAMSLGCAGVSTGLLLLIAQVGVKSTTLIFSLWCSAIAIPFWIGLWQVCDTYSFWGRRAEGHYNQIGWILTFTLLFVVGVVLLFAAIAALVWSLLPGAAVAFIVTSVIALTFAGVHAKQVKDLAESTSRDEALQRSETKR